MNSLISQRIEKAYWMISKPSGVDTITHVFRDSLSTYRQVEDWISEKRSQGFILASLDSTVKDSHQIIFYLFEGKKFSRARLNSDTVSRGILNKWSMHELISTNFKTPFEWNDRFSEFIKKCAKAGHPFASIELKELISREDTLIGQMRVSEGPLIRYRNIDQRNAVLFAPFYIERILHLKSGNIYNHEDILEIENRIQKLGIVQSKYPPRIVYLGNEAVTWIYLERRNTNRFDLLLGLIPTSNPSSRKYRLSGEGNFEINNALKIGEQFLFRYENLEESSPRLQIAFDFPFAYTLPFGIASDFTLQRFKESFLELKSKTTISYPIYKQQRIGVAMDWSSINVLNPDTLTLIQSKRLPKELDVQVISFGIVYHLNQLDDRIFPTKGLQIKWNGQLGMKKFTPNSTLQSYEALGIPVNQQYDSLNLYPEQFEMELHVQYYWKLTKRNVIRFSDQMQNVFARTFIATNEYFRTGGYKTIRGFDENFFITPNWNNFTIEYRFLLDKSSFLHIYSDWATLQQLELDTLTWHNFQSIGVGIQFQTKIGAFGLQYAMGREATTSFDFGSGKIHFGYSSLF